MNTSTYETGITYPPIGFAFNPIRVIVNKGVAIKGLVKLESNGFVIEKELLDENTPLSFELSAIARALFDRREFYKVEEFDTTLLKMLEFKVTDDRGTLVDVRMPVVWGALQIGEIYSQNKTLTYFKGYPFTVPLYTDSPVVLKANEKEYKTLQAGKHNIDISDINSSGKIAIEVFDEKKYKIFDYTFDSTFGPQRVLLPKGLSIIVNVVDCPNEGVYLRWINKHGEYNYYLFQSGSSSSTTKSNEIYFDNVYYTTDLTNNYHQGTGKSIGKDIDYSQRLYASLVDSQTFDSLVDLVESPVVDLFLGYNDDKSQKWISVSIADGTFSKSRDHLQDFEFSLIPNKRLIQTL